jgi:hypothetical protein
VGLAISQSLFIGGLKQELKVYNLPQTTLVAITGSVELIWTLPIELQKIVIEAYVISLHHVYIVAVPAAILAGIASIMVKRHNIKKMGLKPGAGAA